MAKKNGFDIRSLVGKNVIIRTVTNYYTGKLVARSDGYLSLEDAAWIADTGRWANAHSTGQLSEVEPYPAGCLVGEGSIVDLAEWKFPLPRTVI